MFKILVAEDDENLNKIICLKLAQEGFSPLAAFDGRQAIKLLESERADLVVTDIMMPGLSGYELTKQIKLLDESLPVLMITAKSGMDGMEKGFVTGADDYMSKPLNLKELILRINALLRRAKIASGKRLRFKNSELDYAALSLKIGGEAVELAPKEFYLLFLLLSNPGKIFTRLEIMQEIWGYDTDSDERAVDTHVKKLRRKLENCTDFEIATVRSIGYKGEIYE